jgi:hypothetical protein
MVILPLSARAGVIALDPEMLSKTKKTIVLENCFTTSPLCSLAMSKPIGTALAKHWHNAACIYPLTARRIFCSPFLKKTCANEERRPTEIQYQTAVFFQAYQALQQAN